MSHPDTYAVGLLGLGMTALGFLLAFGVLAVLHLKHLCATLGAHLATIEGKRGILSHLDLDTRLREERSPVLLPEVRDSPVISYLTAAEVRNEFERFRKMDLSFPASAEVEEDRKALLECLKKATNKRAGIVAFYH